MDEGGLWQEFCDYRDVGGIQMPSKERMNPKYPMYPIAFQFNVEYDPEIFERPPSVEAGPDAWRPKSTSPADNLTNDPTR